MLDQSSEHVLQAEATSEALTKEPAGFVGSVTEAIEAASAALFRLQHADGHWCFELEADCTIPSEYILMMHFLDDVDSVLQGKIANYIRGHQASHGGWPLFTGGDLDISCSVKAYYALKIAGDNPEDEHMVKAREAILAAGGAARSNVFTRILLAMFQQVPWRAVPFIPVEMLLLPRWFPFHIYKISYWSRTVLVPLSILYSLKATAKNPGNVGIRELFTTDPEEERDYFPVRSKLNTFILGFERFARLFEPLVPDFLRRFAIKKAMDWLLPRLNGEDGLGGIFPAMVNIYEVLVLLNYPEDHEYRVMAKQALLKMLVIDGDSAYCQPCLSPVWDTALTALALNEADFKPQSALYSALDWLADRQIRDVDGDWRVRAPGLAGGGWAFQYRNDYYPDIDDTAAVAWAMLELDADRYRENLDSAAGWVMGMQSKNGGFAAFDKDNTYYYLNEIPFADHGALLDPPTSDVSARCLTLLGDPNYRQKKSYAKTLQRCIQYLLDEQEKTGAWYGRWGTNYIYGTWSVLTGMEKAGESPEQLPIKRAIKWLKSVQREDGGWGEDNNTYLQAEMAGRADHSTSFQTAWALLALMAAGEVDSIEVKRGIEYLLEQQQEGGLWCDNVFTAPGFPRVFYLKYHGYSKFFPLWALARYRNLRFAGTS